MTQSELADAVNVTRQTIISLESGRYNASLILAHKIAQFFEVSIEEVFIFDQKAFRIAAYAMLIALYATALIGGLFYPILVRALMFIVCTFLLAYTISFKYYNNKM